MRHLHDLFSLSLFLLLLLFARTLTRLTVKVRSGWLSSLRIRPSVPPRPTLDRPGARSNLGHLLVWDRYRLGHPAVGVEQTCPGLMYSQATVSSRPGASCAPLGRQPERWEYKAVVSAEVSLPGPLGASCVLMYATAYGAHGVERVPPQAAPPWNGRRPKVPSEGQIQSRSSAPLAIRRGR